jgi:hypothetical protein
MPSQHTFRQRQKLLAALSSLLVVILLAAHPLHAQCVTTTVAAGTNPRAVAVTRDQQNLRGQLQTARRRERM